MDLAKATLVHLFEEMRHRNSVSIFLHFNHSDYLNIVIDHQAISPITISMQIRLQFNRFAQAPDDKCGEREFLSTLTLMRSHMLTGAGHVNFDESMYYVLPSTKTPGIERKSAYLGKGLNSIFFIFHCT